MILQSFQKDKSPGQDGLPVEFFLGFYDFIEEYVWRVVDLTRSIGKTFGSFKTTFITLIQKVDNSTSFEKFTPIYSCNYKFKIISNLIARRLKRVFPRKIFED
jgi:hypothetical protein